MSTLDGVLTKKSHSAFRLALVVCLGLGLAAYLTFAGRTVRADDPSPVEGERQATLSPTAPRVGINGALCTYDTIQEAVSNASPGDTIQAAAGTYLETVAVTKNLTIVGGYDVDCIAYITGTTTVDAGGASSVFTVTGSIVTLRNLGITGGHGGNGGGVRVLSGSAVTLDNTDVFGNQATNHGGGVYVNSGCVLTLTHDSDVTANTAGASGGGARVWGRLVGEDWLSTIANNSAPDGGGVSVAADGELYLSGSHVMDNTATGAQGKGGGIYVDSGDVTLTGSSNVALNDAYDGAGIYADDASLSLAAVVHSNVATHDGGGVYLANGSILRTRGTIIGDDVPARGNEAVRGAGIYAVASTVEFEDGEIYNNRASERGAGLYAAASAITLANAAVGGTGANQANDVTGGVFGAGLYLSATHALLSNTVVASNTFSSGAGWGGGVMAWDGSVVTLTNSRVEYHYAPNVWMFGGAGAGLLIHNSTATLSNSQVLSNTAVIAGGGIYMVETSTLTVLGDSIVGNNHAISGTGGGIASTGTPDITISESTLQANTAGTDGGAIYLPAGTLDFDGWWDVRDNSAGGNGGAVAVTGSGDVDLASDSGYSYLVSNDAGGHGGALYVGNTDVVELYADGPRLFVRSNTAGGDGGAAYAGNGGGFDVRGRLRANANSAAGNGGAFYLGGGSQLGLDVYGSDLLSFEANDASNGGAVYAAGGSTVRCDGAQFGSETSGNRVGSSGGALYLSGSALTSTNCLFLNNLAQDNGGAIAAYTSSLTLDADYATCDPSAVQCSAIYSNTADSDGNDSGDGGGLYVGDSALSVNHTTLHRNSAARGGAIYQAGASASAQVRNSLVYSNAVSLSFGAGIRTAGGVFTLTHTTVANNSGGGAYSQSPSTASAVHNSIAWGNDTGGFLGTFVTTTCNIDQSGNAGASTDPQFVAPGAGEDYHLQGSSPAIDACDTGLSPDLDGVLRPAGSKYDMGAYEYVTYGVAFAPDREASQVPGSELSYTHALTNTGNVTDTYTLTVHSSRGWSVIAIPMPTVTLSSGESSLVTVTLSVPPGSGGLVDTVSVVATSQADPGVQAGVLDTVTAVYSATASRSDILAAGVYTFGDTCAQVSFASDADRGELTAVTVTLVYSYPTGQIAARPLPRRYTIEGNRSGGFSATLSLCYLDAEWMWVGIGDESALQLYRYAGAPTWEVYASTVDTTTNYVTATIHELSPWAIGAPGNEPTAVSLKAGSLKTAGLKADSSLRVPGGIAGWLIAILGAGLLCLAGRWTLRRISLSPPGRG